MKQVYDGVVYDTDTATLLARNEPVKFGLAEHDQKRIGLYRTVNGRYFSFTELIFPSISHRANQVTINPLKTQDAINEYNKLTVRKYDFKEAFPDVDFTEA